jgi:hypothetical protein
MAIGCNAQENMFKLSYIMLQKNFPVGSLGARAPVPHSWRRHCIVSLAMKSCIKHGTDELFNLFLTSVHEYCATWSAEWRRRAQRTESGLTTVQTDLDSTTGCWLLAEPC